MENLEHLLKLQGDELVKELRKFSIDPPSPLAAHLANQLEEAHKDACDMAALAAELSLKSLERCTKVRQLNEQVENLKKVNSNLQIETEWIRRESVSFQDSRNTLLAQIEDMQYKLANKWSRWWVLGAFVAGAILSNRFRLV